MPTRRWALALIAGLPVIAPAAAARAATERPSLDSLLREPLARHASMSPNGKRIAVVLMQGEERKRVAALLLYDADNPEAPPKQVGLGNYYIDGLYWANDDRLLVRFIVEREEDYVPTGSRIGVRYSNNFRRLMSVRADGTDPVLMFGDQKGVQRENWDLGRVVDLLPDDPDHILMMSWEIGELGAWVASRALQRVNVDTGQATFVERGLSNTTRWDIQAGVPVLRYDLAPNGRVVHVMGRVPGEAQYSLVRRMVLETEWERPNFSILGATDEPGVFLVATQGSGDPAAAIRKYDVRSRALGDVVAARPDRDMTDVLTDAKGRFVAAGYVEDRQAYAFADPKFAPHFRAMEGFFGRKYSVELYQTNLDHTRYLARVSGPGVHSAFYFYDMAATRFQVLGLGMPWLDAEALGQVEALDVRTRDGAAIRAYLTVPPGAGPFPLVVMPHGGPQARDGVTFDLFAQVMAAQGWMVLQPNFRGSGGYGEAFARAGHGRWGDRMQEDVEDAVAQVMAAGRVDPGRVAIFGASYGGYAALMGAVRRPELYRAAVSVAGISDLPKWLSNFKWRDDGDEELYYRLWRDRMGDPETEMDKLRAASPALRAAEIKAPVLLIHGLDDEIVPHQQSAYMAAALRAARKPCEHVEVKDAGHGGWDEKERRLILGKAIDFIAKAFA